MLYTISERSIWGKIMKRNLHFCYTVLDSITESVRLIKYNLLNAYEAALNLQHLTKTVRERKDPDYPHFFLLPQSFERFTFFESFFFFKLYCCVKD